MGQAGVFADGSSRAPRFDGTPWIEVEGDAFAFSDQSAYAIEADRVTTQGDPGAWIGSDYGLVLAAQATHVVATYDGDRMPLCINGNEVYTKDGVTGDLPGTIENLHLGAARNGTKFRGLIDEVAIFDYALSPQHIDRHFRAAQP